MPKELSPGKQEQKTRLEEALKNQDLSFLTRGRRILALLPSDPRCAVCLAPFEGLGASIVKTVLNKKRSALNPLMCNTCEEIIRDLEYGTEVEMSILFVDVRGSTQLAEKMTPTEYKELIDRFYNETTHVLVHSYALIDKLVGDEVCGYYLPSFAGADFVRKSIDAAREVMEVTGHSRTDGPWVPAGAGIHTGSAYFGAVSTTDGLVELTALGDAVNTASRLASRASAGEIIISESTFHKAGIGAENLDQRTLELKGKSEPMDAWVIRVH